MEKELEILLNIEENENITQRNLAEKTGMALGSVNLLLKKMIETGLIKIEKLNTRTVKYILTPNGMMEKARKTYDYVKKTYQSIMDMQREVIKIVEGIPQNSTLCLYGEEDEVCRMLTILLNQAVDGSGIDLKRVKSPEEIDNGDIVIVWNGSDKPAGMKCINIMERILRDTNEFV